MELETEPRQPPPTGQLRRRLTLYYVLALSAVAVVFAIGQSVIQSDLDRQAANLERIDLTHRQIVRSHRLVQELAQGDSQEILPICQGLETDQKTLAGGLSPNDFPLVLAAQAELDVVLQESRRRPDLVVEIAGHLSAYRAAMEDVLVALNDQVRMSHHELQSHQWALMGAVLLVLLCEGLLFFKPASRRLAGFVEEVQSARDSLDNRLRALRDSHEVLKADLKSAAAVQMSLLPRQTPRVTGVDFAWSFKACQHVAGDMFHVLPLDDSRVAIYLLDVSGHGLPAALLSVSISRTITSNVGSLLMKRATGRREVQIMRPAQVAAELNRRFPVMSESDQFFTLLYGVLDVKESTFTFVQAGHPGPLWLTRASTRYFEVPSDPPIGILEGIEFHEETLKLEPGDLLVFYTDGLVEAIDLQGNQFGLQRALGVVSEHRSEGVAGCVERLYQSLREFTRGCTPRDDITILGFELAAGAGGAKVSTVTASGRHKSSRELAGVGTATLP